MENERMSIEEMTGGLFYSSGTGGHWVTQCKDAEWKVIYDWVQKLAHYPYTVEVRVPVKREDFRLISGKYDLIEHAIERGYLSMDAHTRLDDAIDLMTNLEWDYGDADGFGMEVTNLWATIDRDGNFVKPFHAG